MIELQVLSRILKKQDLSFLQSAGVEDEYFKVYVNEYQFIKNHYLQYGNVPDKETFISKFPEITLVDVNETDKYLIETFSEEHLYSLTVPVINKLAEIIQVDSRQAVEYLRSQLPALSVKSMTQGIDIIATASQRLSEWEKRKKDPEKFCIPTGFMEIDEITGGWQRGEEFVVLFARTGQGKSWVLIKSLEHAWKMKYRVGLIEPEMSAVKTGYRFDTLHKNFSNTALTRGRDVNNYHEYIEDLKKSEVPLLVASPSDFNRNITVSKLKQFAINNKLDILAIDGISYLADERKQRGDNRSTSLTNISEDLMDLSIELKIPIIVVAQSNREGVHEDNAPNLENIRDSDGIAFNSSTVIAIKQKGPGLEMSVIKNRNGRTGEKLIYLWDIDTGKFAYVPSSEVSSPARAPKEGERITKVAQEFSDGTEVF